MSKYIKYQDALAALSLANLLFLRVWRELLFAEGADAYWIPDYTPASYLAAVLNVTWIAVALFSIAVLVRRMNRRGTRILMYLGVVLLLVLPLDFLRALMHIDTGTVHWCLDHLVLSGAIALASAACAVYLLVRRLEPTVGAFRWALLALTPFAALTLIPAAYRGLFPPNEASETAHAEADRPRDVRGEDGRPRIIWLLFDELDSRLAFLQRPADVALPNFDRLRAQSVVDFNCQTHGMVTCRAIPAYMTGTIVSDAKPVSRDELLVEFQGQPAGKHVSFADCRTLFGALRDRGATSAVIGNYHPYDRMLGDDVDYCSVYTIDTYTPLATNGVLTEMSSQLLGITPLFRRINAIAMCKGILSDCIEVSRDPRYDLVFVHVSVPHGPNIYDRRRQRFTLINAARDGYLDNLVLADRFLGEVRRSLEENAMWDQSVILVNSDHELRYPQFGDRQRVAKTPLMIKMPGQREQVVIEDRLSPTLLTKDLLLAVLDGEVKTSADVVRWLRRASASHSRSSATVEAQPPAEK